ncbi:MAG: hypothetical protein RCG15_07385 [Candidatus Rickettsia vulgarisii]
MGFGIIIAGCNGISFGYFAEGSFYLIQNLGLSPKEYGFSFMIIAAAMMMGGILSKKLQTHYSSVKIMEFGLNIIAIATAIFSFIAIIHHNI